MHSGLLTSDYKTGNERIDGDHQIICSLIELLTAALKTGKDKAACVRTYNELLDYTQTHFAMEEDLMRHCNYPQAAAHKAEHDNFIARTTDFKNQLAAGSFVLGVEMLTFLLDWWRSHIQRADKKLVGSLSLSDRNNYPPI